MDYRVRHDFGTEDNKKEFHVNKNMGVASHFYPFVEHIWIYDYKYTMHISNKRA